MKKITLGDVCRKASSNIAQKDLLSRKGEYPIYGASGLIKYVDFYHQDQEYIAVVKDGAGIGRAMLLPAYSSVIGTMQYILPNEDADVNIRYLYYAIVHMDLSKYFNGATIPHIYFKDYQKERLRLPEIGKQCKIAYVLKKVDDIIYLRKAQIVELDKLVKSRFIELFGDPEVNPFNWPIITVGAVIKSCESGWSGNGTQKPRKSGELAVLKVSAVTKGYFIPEECKVLDDQKNIKKYVFPEKGDLLFSRANTREMVGATAVILQDYPDLILPDKLWKIRFVDTVNVLYMKYALSSPSIRSKFSAVSTGTSGSMYNVSMDKFKAIVIPLPDCDTQQRFAAFVTQINKSKLAVNNSLKKLEILKKALMQQYFG